MPTTVTTLKPKHAAQSTPSDTKWEGGGPTVPQHVQNAASRLGRCDCLDDFGRELERDGEHDER